MFRASTARHQEVRCMYVASGTSMINKYTLPPDDGMLMPETYRGISV
jgi:hypothetical protein